MRSGEFYTRAVLTVIAAALVAIVVQNSTSRAVAQPILCGERSNPCYVKSNSDDSVYVTNGGSFSKPLEVRIVR